VDRSRDRRAYLDDTRATLPTRVARRPSCVARRARVGDTQNMNKNDHLGVGMLEIMLKLYTEVVDHFTRRSFSS